MWLLTNLEESRSAAAAALVVPAAWVGHARLDDVGVVRDVGEPMSELFLEWCGDLIRRLPRNWVIRALDR